MHTAVIQDVPDQARVLVVHPGSQAALNRLHGIFNAGYLVGFAGIGLLIGGAVSDDGSAKTLQIVGGSLAGVGFLAIPALVMQVLAPLWRTTQAFYSSE